MRTTQRFTSAKPKLRLRLRTSEWDRLTRARGLSTDAACADLLGISRDTIRRARDNQVEPSPGFISAAIWHLPEIKFEQLFEVVAEKVA